MHCKVSHSDAVGHEIRVDALLLNEGNAWFATMAIALATPPWMRLVGEPQ